jgi:ABC-type branched-subunit amino acid transport system substrate-binding protein
MAANFMLNKMKKKRIAILYDETTSYTNDLKNDFAEDIPHNIVGSENYSGDKLGTVQGALNLALAQNPDAIFFSGHVRDLLVLLQDISSTSSTNLLIVGGDALAITSNYLNPLPRLDNVYFTAFASPDEWDDTNQALPFFQGYRNNFGTLTAPTGLPSIDADVMLSYDALSTLLHASQQVLSTKNTLNSPDLIEALKQITGANAIQGITGRISFNGNGDPQDKRVILEHIQETRLKVDNSLGCFRLTDNCSS